MDTERPQENSVSVAEISPEIAVPRPETEPGPDRSSGSRPGVLLSVIVPARDEEDSIGACIGSLVAQSEPDFLLGRDWELFVVDDDSTDATRKIALEFSDVTVLDAPPLEPGWTGKANAVWFAAQQAQGEWLLFTDADTIHEPGNLRRAVHEAQRYRVSMLSYSPHQRVKGFWQRALMPLVFAELVRKFPPRLVNLPDSSVAAANGQFLLVQHGAYRRLGGHQAVRGAVLEDVELAQRFKRAHEGLRFRYAPDAVSTRMYRSFRAMCEGWKKNLALLFPDAFSRAVVELAQAALLFGLPVVAVWLGVAANRVGIAGAIGLWWAWRLGVHCSRVSKANFGLVNTLLSPLALPLFSVLLFESWLRKASHGKVTWKGRSYPM